MWKTRTSQAAFISVSCAAECEFLRFGTCISTCEIQGFDFHGSACLATVRTDFTWSNVALGESRVGGAWERLTLEPVDGVKTMDPQHRGVSYNLWKRKRQQKMEWKGCPPFEQFLNWKWLFLTLDPGFDHGSLWTPDCLSTHCQAWHL